MSDRGKVEEKHSKSSPRTPRTPRTPKETPKTPRTPRTPREEGGKDSSSSSSEKAADQLHHQKSRRGLDIESDSHHSSHHHTSHHHSSTKEGGGDGGKLVRENSEHRHGSSKGSGGDGGKLVRESSEHHHHSHSRKDGHDKKTEREKSKESLKQKEVSKESKESKQSEEAKTEELKEDETKATVKNDDQQNEDKSVSKQPDGDTKLDLDDSVVNSPNLKTSPSSKEPSPGESGKTTPVPPLSSTERVFGFPSYDSSGSKSPTGNQQQDCSRSCANSPGSSKDEDFRPPEIPRRFSDASPSVETHELNVAGKGPRSPHTINAPTASPTVFLRRSRHRHSSSSSAYVNTISVPLLGSASPASSATPSPTSQQPTSSKDLGVFSFSENRRRQAIERRSKTIEPSDVKKEEPKDIGKKVAAQKHLGKWQFLEPIGKGFHGTTYRGQHVDSLQEVIIKELHMRQISSPHVEQMKDAFSSLERLEHQNVVKLLDIVLHRKHLYTIAESIHGVSLGTILKHHGKLPEKMAALCCVQVLDGLRYLHSFAIVHGDIHPNNVIVDGDGTCRLTDIDLKCFAERANKSANIANRKNASSAGSDVPSLNLVGFSICGCRKKSRHN